MPDVFGNFNPPHICLEVLHLPAHRKGLAARRRDAPRPETQTLSLPVKLDTHLLIYGYTRACTHVWDTLDVISQSVTHDGVSHAVEIDVGSRREWLPDSYQAAEWPAATPLLRRRLKEGLRFQLWAWAMGRGEAVFRKRGAQQGT